MLEIIDTVAEWIKAGRSVALATVVDTWGSAPRRIGAKMAVTDDMKMIGSVSGGCVETTVVQEAVESLQDGKPRLLQYGVSDDVAWNVGLACGGKIAIFVEPLDRAWWDVMINAVQTSDPIMAATIVAGEAAGQKVIFDRNGEPRYMTENLSADQKQALLEASKPIFENGESAHFKDENFNLLVDVHRPQPHLIMIGGVHIAIPLQSFAKQLGFRITLIDPRKAFATADRFPDLSKIIHQYPDKALPGLNLDKDTFLVVLTHDPKIDDPALKTALCSPVPYIGVLSSKRTHEKRIERLTKDGVDPALLDRIRTPIGINIGAKTPEEIALCIMAEIIAVRNGVLK